MTMERHDQHSPVDGRQRETCRRLLKAGLVSGAAMATVTAMPATAQTPEPAGAQVEEIIVTAQRRAERLLDTPLAVTALSGRELDKRGFNNVTDIATAVPNVQINQGSGSVNQFVVIRGSSQTNDALFYDQPAGLYLDGIYIGKSEGGLFDIGDIERVEVLRGPQGTLYGRNTLAGAINIITRKPDGNPEAILTASLGNYGATNVRATVATPQIGKFAARFTFDHRYHNGYVKNRADPYGSPLAAAPQTSDLQRLNSLAARLAVRMTATDALTLDYVVDYNRQRNRQMYPVLDHFYQASPNERPVCVPGAPANPSFDCPTGSGGITGLTEIFDPTSPSYIGIDLSPYIRQNRSSVAHLNESMAERNKVWGHSLTATLDLGGVEAKSITGYRTMKSFRNTDFDGSPLPLIAVDLHNKFKAFSQELQLTGTSQRLDYVAGLYYYWDEGKSILPQRILSPGYYDSRYESGTEAYAAYAQADWTPPILDDRLKLTGGIRYTHEKKDTQRYFSIVTPGLPDFVLIPNVKADKSFSNVSPTVSVSFRLADDTNLYARYAKGFKSGGFNGQAGSAAESLRPFGAEKVDAYEVGLKSRFWDGRAQISSALFYEKHNDMQVNLFVATEGFSNVVRNAGAATIKGLELDGTLALTERLTFGFSYGYLDAKFKHFVVGASDQASERVVPRAPKHSFSVNGDAILAEGDFGRLRLRADYSWVSDQYHQAFLRNPNLASTDNNDWPDARGDAFIPSYGILDGRLTLEDVSVGSATASIALYGRNILDKKYRVGTVPFGAGLGGLTYYYYGAPATYGVELTLKY